MYIKQSDLLWGLDKHFIQVFFEPAVKKTHPQGFMLFKKGDPAEYFYILVKGSISLHPGGETKTAYLVNHAGEAFGWSSLVGMDTYTASAECLRESVVMRFNKETVREMAEADPLNGMKFFRRLARMLGNRLVHSYQHETETVPEGLDLSFGSGQSIKAYTTP
ncbi:MAG: Crp/Fnr family transcriptional regulator [Desulforhopalus sp.]